MEWITDVDMLADAGVINYDAASRILGTKPRYIGRPEVRRLPGDFEYFYAPLKEDKFDFQAKSKKPNDTPAWKKVLFGGVVIAAAVGTFLFGKKLKNYDFKKLPKLLKVNTKLILHKAKRVIKTLGNKIANVFKKAPATP